MLIDGLILALNLGFSKIIVEVDAKKPLLNINKK